jgi:uncharacterized membrane protein YozB (DUF420 family)
VDPKVAYWTAAWINMALIVALGIAGVRQISRGRFETHRRLMLAAAWLVVGFVVSYVVKLAALGRETLETWDSSYVVVLRVHELCVAVLVGAGALALWKALALGLPIASASREPARTTVRDPETLFRGVRLHRRAGFLALGSATFGLATAAYVLFGMWTR